MSNNTLTSHTTYTTWLLVFLLIVFSLIRFYKLGYWSLWEDEETTIYFSQHLDKWFAQYSPVYFRSLSAVFKISGISVWSGRAFSAFCGILTIFVFYWGFRRQIPYKAALISAALLSVNLGHFFWSQSIRYYALTLLFNALSISLFLDGFERSRPVQLFLSPLLWGFGLMCHFSSVLLGPVFIGYLIVITFIDKKKSFAQKRDYIVYLTSFIIVSIYFASQLLEVRQYQLGINPPENKDPVHILITLIAYFGIQIIAIGTAAIVLAKKIPLKMRLFFTICAIMPVLELLVIAKLGLVKVVTWYYGLVAIIGFCFLSGIGLAELLESKYRKIAVGLTILTFGFYTIFLVGYFGPMHGDRPRWKDGAQYIISALGPDAVSRKNIKIYAHVTGVMEFYLGVPPNQTMHDNTVFPLPVKPPQLNDGIDRWFVVKATHITKTYSDWFENNCELKAKFKARTGPRDRSVLVFHAIPPKT